MSDTPSEAGEVPSDLLTWDHRPAATLYRRGANPRLLVYTQGEWREAVVTEKDAWPDGRVSVRCAVRLPGHITGPSIEARHYWWAPACMRLAPEDS